MQVALRYTAQGSKSPNDMMLTATSTYSALTNEPIPEGVARISCTLELPDGSGYLRLASADPHVQPLFDYCYFQNSNDIRRMR